MRRFSFTTRKRLSAATILGLLALLVLTIPAGAFGVSWCRADPIVRLNGTEVQIWVAVPAEYAPLVNGPIDVRIKTPRQVSEELILTDAGFNGHGETVTFSDMPGKVRRGAFDTLVEVRVPIDARDLPFGTVVPVRVEVIPANGETLYFDGTTHMTVFKFKVQGEK
jgi:hypothetical protein